MNQPSKQLGKLLSQPPHGLLMVMHLTFSMCYAHARTHTRPVVNVYSIGSQHFTLDINCHPDLSQTNSHANCKKRDIFTCSGWALGGNALIHNYYGKKAMASWNQWTEIISNDANAPSVLFCKHKWTENINEKRHKWMEYTQSNPIFQNNNKP